jgi:hypothetical protein
MIEDALWQNVTELDIQIKTAASYATLKATYSTKEFLASLSEF